MRLLSYNIHKGIGGRDRRYRIDRIQKVIADLAPDVVCLQEVDRNVKRTRHDNQPEQLAGSFAGAGVLYQLNVHLKGGGYGNLILSRWPLRTSHQVSLRLKWRKPRGAQIAVIETPEGPLHLVHWHLGLAEKERHWQVRHLLEHPHFRESAHLPTLIVGDSNDWRNRLAHHSFARHGFTHVTAPPRPLPHLPGLLPGRLSRQGVRARRPRLQPRSRRPHAPDEARLRPPSARDRLSSWRKRRSARGLRNDLNW